MNISRSSALAIGREAIPPLLIIVVLGFVLPSMLSEFRTNLLAKYMTYAILAIGIDLIWGYTGMLSLGQAVWFGLGGYAVAMHLKLVASGDNLPDFMGWTGVDSLPLIWEPFHHAWFALPIALIGPGVLAFALGLLVFRSRVKGAYFAIVTQALALIVGILFVGEPGYTGGTSGITNFSTLFGRTLSDDSTKELLYFTTLAALVATYCLGRWMTKSRFGRLMVAVRDDEDRVRFAGYNVAVVKAVVFGISGAMAGLAGALFVPQVGAITPSSLGIVPSIEFVLFVAVGGRGTLLGPVVGAIAVSWLRTWMSETYPDTWQYYYGGLFIAAVVVLPTGLVGTAQILWARAVVLVRQTVEGTPLDFGQPPVLDAQEGTASGD